MNAFSSRSTLGQPWLEADRVAAHPGADLQLELVGGTSGMRHKLIAPGVRDRNDAAIDASLSASIEHRPHAAGSVRPRVRPLDVLALWLQHGALGVLGPNRLEHRAIDIEQLLDRAFGVRVSALAIVAIEQHPPLVEQVAPRPSQVSVQVPD